MPEPATVSMVTKGKLPAEPTKTRADIESMWKDRRNRMEKHREQFERLWETGVTRFFQGILHGDSGNYSKLYDSLYEQYDLSMFSREGLRFNDIKYPLLHTIVLRAMASEFPNRPVAKFIAVGSNDPTKATAFSHLFQQVLSEGNADLEDFEVFLDRRIRGTGAVLQLTERYPLTVKDPKIDKTGKMTFEEKTKKICDVKFRKIDLRHLYLDEHCRRSDLADCFYAQVDEFMSIEEFKVKFKELGEDKLRDIVELPSDPEASEGDNPFVSDSSVKYVRVTHCFDKKDDLYHVLANGTLVSETDNPIPRIAGRRGKEIPIALAVMYKIPGCPYGYGDAHVTTAFNSIKNLMRLMILEITQKAAKKTLFVHPDSNFDEQAFEFGQDFVRVAPDEVKQMEVDHDFASLYKLDETTDNDIIRGTGININDTTNLDTQETARKTVIRKESQNAIVELGMNYLTISYYKRLYNLMKDDIKLHYGANLGNGEKVQVRTKDIKLTRSKDGLKEYKADGWRFFDLKPGDLDIDAEVMLEAGNISTSKQLEKALQMEGLEATQYAPQGFDPIGLAKYIKEVMEMPDFVLATGEEAVEGRSPEELAKAAIGDPQFLPEAENLKSNPPQDVLEELPQLAGTAQAQQGMGAAPAKAQQSGVPAAGAAAR